MSGTIGAYQQGPMNTPPGGGFAARTRLNGHDGDATIHLQSSTLANRPTAGTAQRVWVSTDGFRAYLDSGSAWNEFAYLPLVGGTVTGAVVVTAAMTVGSLTASAFTDSGPATVGSLTAAAATINADATIGGSLTAVAGLFTGPVTVQAPATFGTAATVIANNGTVTVPDNVAVGGAQASIRPGAMVTITTGTAQTVMAIGGLGAAVVVSGSGGAGVAFTDLVLTAGGGAGVTVIASTTATATPATRTYTKSGTNLQLAVSANTYTVAALALRATLA